MNVKAIFTERLGPLPVIVWAGGAAGAYVVYAYWRASREAPSISPAVAGATVGDLSGEAYPGDGVGVGSYGGGATLNGSFGVSAPPSSLLSPYTFDSDQAWGSAAVRYLTSLGYDATSATDLMSTYLRQSGGTITETQQTMLSRVLAVLGTPPEGLYATPAVGTPPPPTSPAPTPPPTPATPPVPSAVAETPAIRGTITPATDSRRASMDAFQVQLVEGHMQDAKVREGRTITFDQSAAELDRFFRGG